MEQTLKYIAETLMQPAIVSDSGLMYGKTGIAVFFFHYAHYTGDKSLRTYAIELINGCIREQKQQYNVGYANGWAGIGTAVEYLVQNDLVRSDTNKLCKRFDKGIFHEVVNGDRTDVSLFVGLSGLGRYVLYRIAGHGASDEQITWLTNKMLLIHIIDTIERKIPDLKGSEQDDVCDFLYSMHQTAIYPVKTERLLKLFSSNQDDRMNQHKKNREAQYDNKYRKLQSGIQQKEQLNIVPGLYDGLAGIGLYLLSQLDKHHEIWMQLL